MSWCDAPFALAETSDTVDFGLSTLTSPYSTLYTFIAPSLESIAIQKASILGDGTLADIARYDALKTTVLGIPGVAVPPLTNGYQIMILDAQGTVMIDTQSAGNSYANWRLGVLGNKNNLISVMTAAQNPHGLGYETSFSIELLKTRDYLIVRFGPVYQNVGSIMINQPAVVTPNAFPIGGT